MVHWSDLTHFSADVYRNLLQFAGKTYIYKQVHPVGLKPLWEQVLIMTHTNVARIAEALS